MPPCCDIDHKIKVVPRLAPPSKALHRLNKKELEELKNQINVLIEKTTLSQISCLMETQFFLWTKRMVNCKFALTITLGTKSP